MSGDISTRVRQHRSPVSDVIALGRAEPSGRCLHVSFMCVCSLAVAVQEQGQEAEGRTHLCAGEVCRVSQSGRGVLCKCVFPLLMSDIGNEINTATYNLMLSGTVRVRAYARDCTTISSLGGLYLLYLSF